MDPTQRYLTQMIVGAPKRIAMGVPVEVTGGPSMASGAVADAEDVSRTALARLRRWGVIGIAKLVPSRQAYMRLATLGVIAAVGVGLSQMRTLSTSTPKEATPVAVARAPAGGPAMDSISVVKAPFLEPALPEQTLPAVQSSQPSLPFQPAAANQVIPAGLMAPVTPQTNPTPIPQKAVASAGPSKSAAPAAESRSPVRTSRNAEEKRSDEPRALVLDGTKTDQKPQSSDTAPVKPSPKEPSLGENDKRLVGPVSEQSARLATAPVEETKRVRIVDIGHDSSFVLITNPQTRLPQKFTVGQTIFTGETLQKIDAAKGTIQLDSRTVGLQ